MADVKHKPPISEFLYKNECFQIQGAIFEVYKELGCGFLESVYQECLERELFNRGIPFKSKVRIPFFYKGDRLEQFFMPDLICFDLIILELKSVNEITAIHRAQIINYLKISGFQVGLLINFNHYPRVAIERFVI